MKAAAERGEFDVLVTMSADRLQRDTVRGSKEILDILESGVRIFYFLDDREEKIDTPEDELMLPLRGYAAKKERTEASKRSRSILRAKAERGYNTGGRVFGFDNYWVFPDGRRMLAAPGLAKADKDAHTEYAINETEAETVRTIFKMAAAGHGIGVIAKTLNGAARYTALRREYVGDRATPAPRKGTQSWAPSSVREILHRERYRGMVPFGEYRHVWKRGTKKRERQPEWLKTPRPDLRIITDALWAAAQARLAARRAAYIRSTDGRLWGRPDSGRDSAYTLTGHARCACCGGSINVLSGTTGSGERRRKLPLYICSYRHNRGETVCRNDHRIRVETVDHALFDALEATVLTPAVVEAAIERAAQLAAERRRHNPDEPERLRAEIARLRKQVENLIALAAEGQAAPLVGAEIKTRAERIAALEATLAAYGAPPELSELDARRLRKALREEAGRMKDLLRENVPRARQVLRRLLDGPIYLAPAVGLDGRKGYAFEGRTRVGALIGNAFINVASPRGFGSWGALRGESVVRLASIRS
jgi:DNA invertase Pin-like site-specific DNA recombinase